MGGQPVKKILVSARGLFIQEVEVKSLHIRTNISINRKGTTALTVFLLSFFVGIRRRAVSIQHCIFNAVQKFLNRFYFGLCCVLCHFLKICTRILQFLIVPSVGIEYRPIMDTELFNIALADTQAPKLLFLGFFPYSPFSFFWTALKMQCCIKSCISWTSSLSKRC